MTQKTEIIKTCLKKVYNLKNDLIEQIELIIKKEGNKEVSIGADDPYDSGQSPISIYEIEKQGVEAEEYKETIPFNDLAIETLLCILEEILK